MGLLDLVTASNKLAAAPTRSRARISSPWSSRQLSQVVWSDVFGADVPVPVTRAEAMSVPALARGRHLLVSTIAGLPLRAYKGGELLPVQPTWTYRSDTGTSPQMRTAWTVDDLLHFGWSLWAVERGSNGQITDAARVPYTDWDVDQDGRVNIYGSPVDPSSVVLIEGYHEGILSFGSDSVRTAKRLERTVADRAANPTPAVEIHQSTDDELSDDEVDALVDGYVRARQSPSGPVVFTPSSVELRMHGSVATELLIEGRNASAVDMARLMGIPASLVDATGIASSLKYETAATRNQEFRDYALGLYLGPINARLSMDDVTPRGTRIAFDTTDLTTAVPSPSGPITED